MRTLLRLSFVFLMLLMLNACLLGQIKVHVKPQPVTFAVTTGDMTIIAGQGFVYGLPYAGGTAPFTCSLGPTPPSTTAPPSFVTVDATTDHTCTLRADATPASPPGSDYTFTLTVTDTKGVTASVPIVITAN